MSKKIGRPFIFSAQSNVLFGYVGNNSASYIYHKYDIQLIKIDTVTLPAHPGYGSYFTLNTPVESIKKLLDDSIKIGFADKINAFQTGYFGDYRQVKIIANFIKKMLLLKKEAIFLLDPVFGDNGKAYVDIKIIDHIQKYLLPLANFLKPNKFELESLTRTSVQNNDQAVNAARQLITEKCKYVFISGIDQNSYTISDILVSKNSHKIFSYKKLKFGISGSGDVLSSLFLAFLTNGLSPSKSAENTSFITHKILKHANDRNYMPLYMLKQ